MSARASAGGPTYKLAVIMLGTNDLGHGRTPAQILEDVAALHAMCTCLHCTPCHVYVCGAGKRFKKKRDREREKKKRLRCMSCARVCTACQCGRGSTVCQVYAAVVALHVNPSAHTFGL